MPEKFTTSILREHLNSYCEHLQKFSSASPASEESKQLFDELARYYCYMFGDIIDYLDQSR